MASNDILQEDVEFLTLGKILFTIFVLFLQNRNLKKNYDCDGKRKIKKSQQRSRGQSNPNFHKTQLTV